MITEKRQHNNLPLINETGIKKFYIAGFNLTLA